MVVVSTAAIVPSVSMLERGLFLVGEGRTAAIVSSVSKLERGLFLVGEGVVEISFSVAAFFLGSSAFAVFLLAVSRFAVFLVVWRFLGGAGAFAFFRAGGDFGEGDEFFFLLVRPRLGGDATSLLACPA